MIRTFDVEYANTMDCRSVPPCVPSDANAVLKVCSNMLRRTRQPMMLETAHIHLGKKKKQYHCHLRLSKISRLDVRNDNVSQRDGDEEPKQAIEKQDNRNTVEVYYYSEYYCQNGYIPEKIKHTVQTLKLRSYWNRLAQELTCH